MAINAKGMLKYNKKGAMITRIQLFQYTASRQHIEVEKDETESDIYKLSGLGHTYEAKTRRRMH